MINKKYLELVQHYEDCLKQYGDTHLGVDWPRAKDVLVRYKVMLNVIRDLNLSKISLLDFGCGASGLFEYIIKIKLNNIIYSGLDLSKKFIQLSKIKFPNNKYYCLDILTDAKKLPVFDYIVINGVFTEKQQLSFDEMFSFFKKVIIEIFPKAKTGIAFNVMSKQVDWEKPGSFHLPFDLLAKFLVKQVSRNFIIRHDYGLYEYTTYIYR
jgi:SAM-dependent methyltransferase